MSAKPAKTLVTRDNFRFFHRLRVRWAEVDMQKIVFNAHYLMYFDTAMADYWRALALPYETTLHALGGDLYVKKATVEYHASARYDDQLEVGLQCARMGNTSMVFTGAIFRGDELLITGELVYVFADPLTQTAQTVPAALREVLTGYEAGQAMSRVTLGSWHELAAGARQVRIDVFVHEQGVPIEMEWDDEDETAIHALASNRLGLPLATGRLLQPSPGVAKIGRMAVNRVLRGAGLGREVLGALLQAAIDRGDHEVRLHAQRSAQGFYQGLGFEARGEPFDEAGIPHIEMFKRLTNNGIPND
jgi:YbgC/YbaW family acyl-CoA thioester hydrolase